MSVVAMKVYAKSIREYDLIKRRAQELEKSISTYVRDLIMLDINAQDKLTVDFDDDIEFASSLETDKVIEVKERVSIEEIID